MGGNSAHDELCTLNRWLNDSKKGFGSFISGQTAVRARPLTTAEDVSFILRYLDGMTRDPCVKVL